MSMQGPSTEQQIRHDIAMLRQELAQKTDGIWRYVRTETDKKLAELAAIMSAIKTERVGGSKGVVRVEDIPGRRVPYDFLVDIPIGNGVTSRVEQSLTVSQEGLFVAVKRVATFQSAYEFQYTNPSTSAVSRFSGRTFGRYRPIHSAWDINDAQPLSLTTFVNPPPVAPNTANIALPSNLTGIRSMEFDGRITVLNAGSNYPRQNISVPSSFWSAQINAAQDLGALDVFERGEVMTIQVQPNHVNNPPAGNVDGDFMSGVTNSWPYLAGQFDAQEGIVTGGVLGAGANITVDPITRLPDGILTIGWIGYRIIMPVGPVG